MTDGLTPEPSGRVRGRRSKRASRVNPAGRRVGAATRPRSPLRRRSRRWSTPLSGRSRPAISSGVCSWSRPTAPTTRTPLAACTAPGRVIASTYRRDFAADSLQMARGAIVDAIRDCGAPAPGQVCLLQNSASTSWRGGCFRPTGGAPHCCRGLQDRQEPTSCQRRSRHGTAAGRILSPKTAMFPPLPRGSS